MSADQHPAYGRPGCTTDGCGQPAAASACWNTSGRGPQLVAVQPLHPGSPWTVPVCLDCAHHAVDLMLLRSTPQPATTTEEPRP